jgi:hypothetical protein
MTGRAVESSWVRHQLNVQRTFMGAVMTMSCEKQLSKNAIRTLSAINQYRYQRRSGRVWLVGDTVYRLPRLPILNENRSSERAPRTGFLASSLPTKANALLPVAVSNGSGVLRPNGHSTPAAAVCAVKEPPRSGALGACRSAVHRRIDA